MKYLSLLLGWLIFLIVGCGPKEEKAQRTLNGAGATFPYPLYASWASEYYKNTKIKVNYQSIGSGGGIRQIIERTVDFGATDMPLKPEEVEKNNLIQFPAVIGGVVLVVNLPEVPPNSLVLDGSTVCKIFLGEIKSWDSPEIKALNPGVNLPSKPLTPIYRSDGSGTTAIFTHYLTQVCPKWAKEVGFGTSVNWKAGLGAKGNEGVANYVQRTPYTIGYVEYAYALQNKLSWTKMKNALGNIVVPEESSFKEAASFAKLEPEKHFYTWITNVSEKNAWPIVGATYILLAKEKTEVNKEVVKFFDWAFKNGDSMAKNLHYVPLPEEVKEKIRNLWKSHNLY